ncbi:DNA primase small subunit [Nematocida sp. LUAm3]|nr:DNA primase small subunit [Nematocida sp. LUAm3]KAI5173580.1 DNA primase small subunit [Nematocida sp. LUAm2]KAI5176801.1 DNA primase small subunit [Nematocida sp. LUAm1]
MGKEDDLLRYYKEMFPVESIFRWLRYTRTREFSFTLRNEVYVRYLSFKSPVEFRSKLLSDIPEKIDIGAVFLNKPANNCENNIFMAKELVFDVDLTDYLRVCCLDKDICSKCFPLIKCAVKILHFVLSEHFSIKNLLFVFSGGRGIHCWASDPSILPSDTKIRSNILEYLISLKKQEIIDERIDKILLEYKDTCKNSIVFDSESGIPSLYSKIFPKIDASVTKQPKHLLKSPFCIHPRSHRVCIPIFLDTLDDLSLNDIPTLSDVLNDSSLISKYAMLFSMHVNNTYHTSCPLHAPYPLHAP